MHRLRAKNRLRTFTTEFALKDFRFPVSHVHCYVSIFPHQMEELSIFHKRAYSWRGNVEHEQKSSFKNFHWWNHPRASSFLYEMALHDNLKSYLSVDKNEILEMSKTQKWISIQLMQLFSRKVEYYYMTNVYSIFFIYE